MAQIFAKRGRGDSICQKGVWISHLIHSAGIEVNMDIGSIRILVQFLQAPQGYVIPMPAHHVGLREFPIVWVPHSLDSSQSAPLSAGHKRMSTSCNFPPFTQKVVWIPHLEFWGLALNWGWRTNEARVKSVSKPRSSEKIPSSCAHSSWWLSEWMWAN